MYQNSFFMPFAGLKFFIFFFDSVLHWSIEYDVNKV